MELVDTIVVGAGQAGLAMSHFLRHQGREHLVLERARVAERWRCERWDSLRFQSPNWSLRLPGAAYDGDDPDGFASADDVLRFIERYRQRIDAPVMTSTAVSALRCGGPGEPFELTTRRGILRARHVVVATGPYQRPRLPGWRHALPTRLAQLHASEYRHPRALPDGAVLVVGSGASGCQIADELLEAGRRVFLSVGRHRRVPRRYRGRDVFWWRVALGDLDRTARRTPPEQRGPAPLLTGVHGGYEVDLRASARRGLTLLGRLLGEAGGRLVFADDLERNLREGDESRQAFVARVDAFIKAAGLDVPPAEAAAPPQAPAIVASPGSLDVAAQGLGTIIWATGYRFDFDWIHLPVFDAGGAPVQRRGATRVPGLHFLGLPWMHTAKSSFLFGVGEDAAHVASAVRRHAGSLPRAAPPAATPHRAE